MAGFCWALRLLPRDAGPKPQHRARRASLRAGRLLHRQDGFAARAARHVAARAAAGDCHTIFTVSRRAAGVGSGERGDGGHREQSGKCSNSNHAAMIGPCARAVYVESLPIVGLQHQGIPSRYVRMLLLPRHIRV